jgi:hypothetical protein
MAVALERFENFPDATTFSSTNAGTYAETPFVNIGSGTGSQTTTTSDAGHGSSCLESVYASGSAGQFALDASSPVADAVVAFDFKLLAFPTLTDQQFPIGARYASGQIGRLETSNTGQLRASMTSVSSYGTALTLNVWRRLELQIIGAGTASTSLAYYLYTDVDGMSLYDTGGVSGVNTSGLGPVSQWRWGKFSSSATAISCRYDTLRVNYGSSTLLGPYSAGSGINQIGYRQLVSRRAALQAASR